MIVVKMTNNVQNSVMTSSSKFYTFFLFQFPNQALIKIMLIFKIPLKMILESIQNRAKYSFPNILVIDTSYDLVSKKNYTLNINLLSLSNA